MSRIIHAFWLVLIYGLSEGRRLDDVTINNILFFIVSNKYISCCYFFCPVIDHKRRQHVVRTSVTHPAAFRVPLFLLLPHFHVSCNILFGRRTASHNLFIKWSEKVSAIKNHFVFTWTWSSIPSISFFAGAIIWAIGVDAICIHVTDRFVTFAFINIWVKSSWK